MRDRAGGPSRPHQRHSKCKVRTRARQHKMINPVCAFLSKKDSCQKSMACRCPRPPEATRHYCMHFFLPVCMCKFSEWPTGGSEPFRRPETRATNTVLTTEWWHNFQESITPVPHLELFQKKHRKQNHPPIRPNLDLLFALIHFVFVWRAPTRHPITRWSENVQRVQSLDRNRQSNNQSSALLYF